jgi:hypothetical protein
VAPRLVGSMSDENTAKLFIACVGIAGTLLGASLGGYIAWRITCSTQNLTKQLAKDNLRAQERAAIDNMLVKMLEFLMAHPHLEKESYCQKYPALPGDENGKERYEVYCIFVFNFLLRAFRHFENDPKQLGEYIGLEEIISCHHLWWHHDKHNLGYDEPFRRCIQAVYDQMRKDGKLK